MLWGLSVLVVVAVVWCGFGLVVDSSDVLEERLEERGVEDVRCCTVRRKVGVLLDRIEGVWECVDPGVECSGLDVEESDGLDSCCCDSVGALASLALEVRLEGCADVSVVPRGL